MTRYLIALLLMTSCVETKQKAPPKEKALPVQATSNPKEATKHIALEAPAGDSATDRELRSLQQKIEKLPDSADTWELLARAWVKKAREAQQPELYARAEDATKEALRLNPKQLGALEVKGLVLQSEHRFQELSALAKEMTSKDPKDAEAWALAGDAALELGQYDQSVESYQQMLDLKPGLAAYSRVAYLRWLVGDIEGSLQMWDEAINVGFNKNAEQVAFCLSEKALVLWLKGDIAGAERDVKAALTLFPGYAPALILRAKIKFHQKDLMGAQEDLTAAVKVSPGVDAYHWLAAIASKNKDEATEKSAREQLEIMGRRGDFRTLSVSYSATNQSAETALSLAKRDAEQRGGVYTYDAVAFAYLRNKDLARAKEHIELALSQGTQDPMLLAHAGLIYHALGETTLAKEKIRAALAMNPSFDPILIEEISHLFPRD
jgi:tetratricopeptide (TPR) repeat protein